jgi:hypothetical protein
LNIQSHQLRQELSRIFLTEPLYFSLRHRCLKTWMLIQLNTWDYIQTAGVGFKPFLHGRGVRH